MSELVHRVDRTVELFVLEGVEEGVHLLEILGRLLFQPMIAGEEGSKRRKHAEHGLDVLLVAADPKQIATLVDADLLDNLLDDDLSALPKEGAWIGQTEDMVIGVGQCLEARLIRIVARGIEEHTAVDATERIVTGHQHLQP